jgi:spermidine/putrescine-binding protein
MKKIIVSIFLLFLSITIVACNQTPTLYVLNWGEYMNEDLIEKFELENGVKVELQLADSNELMEEKVKNQTTAYDIVIPSDYMIEKLYDEGYLQKIDLAKLTNYSENNFLDGVNVVMSGMFSDNDDITTAYEVSIPYFWGVFGIMYNKSLDGLETYIQDNGWAVFFEEQPSTFTRDLKVGMYDVPRFAYSLSMLYADQAGLVDDEDALNVATDEYLTLSEQVLSMKEYDEWHTDMLKKNVNQGILDYAFVYVGDFFDTYLSLTEDATTELEARELTDHIGIYVPEKTIAFYDGMIIPKNARNTDLAHKFIDFFLDPQNAYENSGIVGYTTTLKLTYDMIYNATEGDIVRSVMVKDYPYNPMTSDNFQGKPLIAFSTEFTYDIASMVNNVKAK